MNPIYEYYQAIQSGEVIVGKWIRIWYEMVVHGIESGQYTYSAKRAQQTIKFLETFCHHHEGPKAPGLIKLELWQRAFISTVFGILDKDGHRQFREVVLIIGRKNGKTLLAGGLSEKMLYFDGEYGARCYYCAPKLDQARLCFDATYQMIQKEPELSAITKKRRTDIYVKDTNSSAMPLAFSARKSDGLNPSFVVNDEIGAWHGEPGLKQYEVLKSALGARTQPMILNISTAGYENDSVYDELIMRCTAVLNGSSKETRLAPFLYMIDDVGRWNDITELAKSNPNLGVSVSVDYLIEEIAVAEQSLPKKSEFITKYCNIKQNSSSAWLTRQDIAKAFPGNQYTLEDFRDCYALLGVDLSQTTDLTAACLLIERGGIIYFFTHFWMPHERLEEATRRDGVQYEAYIKRGFLTLSGENMVDYEDCYNWALDLVREYHIMPMYVGYDRYSAGYLVQGLDAAGFHCESVFQGFNLTGIEDNFEGLLKDGKLQCADDNDLMKIHMLGSAQMIETNTSAHPRKKLVKLDKYSHVDGVAALLDAMCMRQNHWDECGARLMNEE